MMSVKKTKIKPKINIMKNKGARTIDFLWQRRGANITIFAKDQILHISLYLDIQFCFLTLKPILVKLSNSFLLHFLLILSSSNKTEMVRINKFSINRNPVYLKSHL